MDNFSPTLVVISTVGNGLCAVPKQSPEIRPYNNYLFGAMVSFFL